MEIVMIKWYYISKTVNSVYDLVIQIDFTKRFRHTNKKTREARIEVVKKMQNQQENDLDFLSTAFSK